ncbi:MAG: carbohydrate ABC transporter permease [Lachnospiraceae bacterium]|jgi:raffinose/stachyose/melibiose transport system permease protein|nr:carbohydrate ABC transporter permease [Lachnospiraceae bacterium]
MKTRKIFTRILLNLVTILLSLIFVTPMLVIFINSFKSASESNTMSLKLPSKWILDNYFIVAERGKITVSLMNSLLYAVCSAALILILVAMAAFVLSRNRSRLNRFIYYFIILGIAMPVSNVPLMKVMKTLHIINTRPGIILLYAAINIPISLFIVFGFVGSIPKDIDEAAILDGCTPMQLFTNIILHMLKPALVTIFVLNVMGVWNDFTMPLYYLDRSDKWPMTLAVYNFFGMYERQYNLVSADIVLTMCPVLLIFILGQKYIVGGISAGAVKG